ncbi:MAG: ribose-phosphate diphosphokinase, partial [Gammaproteobacteria bacterium]|nr:ribose-phosphate diphosphokinase [Gammaproteobacteria bacterium]NIV19577.1 ribose-phosphate diphosphokinase [Gammaproteobacteria bacterium]NIY31333.1 ribose-phosphate diphosphokinase [Gammaproteobacteria bacterium]
MRVLTFPAYRELAASLAQALGCELDQVDVHRFPDGESLVTVPPSRPGTLVVVCGLENPNDKLVELYLALGAARDNGAERLVLVAPYLCYMRQDKAFEPGQAVSQRLIGEMLSGWVDDLITVDPHLHRTPTLDAALPHCRSTAVSAAPLLGRFLQQREDGALLMGPDEESRQWVEAVASHCGLETAVATKARSGDRAVRITLPDRDYRDRSVILVDDVISS